MSEQAVKKLRVVPAAEVRTGGGEQAIGLVAFVDATGAPVEIGGGGGGLDPATEVRIEALEEKVATLEGKVAALEAAGGGA